MSKKKLTQGQKRSMAFQRMQNPPKEKEVKQTVWEKRGQTFEEYQKRDTSGIDKFYGVNPSEKQVVKKESNPESIQSLKRNLRLVKGTGKIMIEGKLQKITSKFVRERLAKTA